MMERQMPQEPIMIYVGVDSVTEYSNKVERLGGRVIKQKTDVPGYGWFAICTDTENNGFALWDYLQLVSRFLEANCHNLHSSFFTIGQCDKEKRHNPRS